MNPAFNNQCGVVPQYTADTTKFTCSTNTATNEMTINWYTMSNDCTQTTGQTPISATLNYDNGCHSMPMTLPGLTTQQYYYKMSQYATPATSGGSCALSGTMYKDSACTNVIVNQAPYTSYIQGLSANSCTQLGITYSFMSTCNSTQLTTTAYDSTKDCTSTSAVPVTWSVGKCFPASQWYGGDYYMILSYTNPSPTPNNTNNSTDGAAAIATGFAAALAVVATLF